METIHPLLTFVFSPCGWPPFGWKAFLLIETCLAVNERAWIEEAERDFKAPSS